MEEDRKREEWSERETERERERMGTAVAYITQQLGAKSHAMLTTKVSYNY